MSKWYSVCVYCGLGLPEDQPEINKDCDHPAWKFVKEEEKKEET